MPPEWSCARRLQVSEGEGMLLALAGIFLFASRIALGVIPMGIMSFSGHNRQEDHVHGSVRALDSLGIGRNGGLSLIGQVR